MKRPGISQEGFLWIPGGMAIGGLALGEAAVALERAGWLTVGDLYRGDASAAFGLLTAVAGAALTVAGTTFSITVTAFVLAATQMGPRLLRNFRLDRGNKVVFGLFLATFAYCVGVLRAIGTDGSRPFIPEVGVVGAVGLALGCVGGLVWFVHHAASSVDVMHVISSVHKDVVAGLIDASVPANVPDEPEAETLGEARSIRSDRGGYVQTVDRERLLGRAAGKNVTIRLLVRPGDYVSVHSPVAEIRPPKSVDVVAAMRIGERRTPEDDPEFAVRQLVEIAVRALSPAINDPYTAVAVLDRLGDAACSLKGRRLEGSWTRRRGKGTVTVPGTDADGLIDAMFLLIVQNGARSPVVVIHALEVLATVAGCWEDSDARRAILRIVDEAVETAAEAMHARDLADVRDRASRFEIYR